MNYITMSPKNSLDFMDKKIIMPKPNNGVVELSINSIKPIDETPKAATFNKNRDEGRIVQNN